MLVDQAVIYVQAGHGGDGVVSFRREAFVPKGGPDGGDGGDGGNVYLLAKAGVDTLLDMAGRHHWQATDGQPGRGKSQSGKGGVDLIIQVPPGTLIYDDETDELICDLDQPDKQLLVAPGGKGGYGNEHFKHATNQVPRQFTPGTKGERRRIRLELKLIADVGLVGKPNAGKSTLLSRLSRATPRIADYPFTTREPQLGIAELPGYRRIIVADIPGLIDGAHTGAGLGHAFLRHIERTRILVHLLEAEPADGSDAVENFRVICEELKNYSPVLASKPMLVALNKIDLLGDEEDHQAARELVSSELGVPVILVSAATGTGCRDLLERCWQVLDEQK